MNLVTSAAPVAEISSFTLSLQKAGFYGQPIGLPLYSAAVVFLSFLACSQRSQIGCLPYFHA